MTFHVPRLNRFVVRTEMSKYVLLTEQLSKNNWLWFSWNITKGCNVARAIQIYWSACVTIYLFHSLVVFSSGDHPWIKLMMKELWRAPSTEHSNNVHFETHTNTKTQNLFMFWMHTSGWCFHFPLGDWRPTTDGLRSAIHRQRGTMCTVYNIRCIRLLFNLYIAFNGIWVGQSWNG